MSNLKTAALVAVALSLVLAGCSTGPGGGNGAGPSATDVREDAVTAMDGVETYRVSASENRSVEGALQQELDVEMTKTVDRTDRRLQVNQTTSTGTQSLETEVYIVDETVYRRSELYVRQYNSEWIKTDASENFSLVWQTQDTLERHQRVLNVSEVELDGTESVDGTEAYVLEASPDTDELERVFAELYGGAGSDLDENNVNVSDAHYTVYVDKESDRPVRIEGRLNTTITNRGQSLELEQSFAFTYEGYGEDVSITLPDEAGDAVAVGNGRVAPTDGTASTRVRAH